MRRRHHLWIVMLVPIVVVLAGAGPASAQEERHEDLVVLTGRAEVAEGDSIDSLWKAWLELLHCAADSG